MKTKLLIFNLLIYIVTGFSQTNISGLIPNSTIWTLDKSPYIITGNTVLVENATLTIEPGVEIRLNYRISMLIQGELIAIGKEDTPIRFTSNEVNNWGIINFTETSVGAIYDINGLYISGSIIKNCIIENGGSSGVDGVIRLDDANPYIANNSILNNNRGGIHCDLTNNQNLSVIIENNLIKGNITYINSGCIFVKKSKNSRITNNTIVKNSISSAVYTTDNRNMLVKNNIISLNYNPWANNTSSLSVAGDYSCQVIGNIVASNKNGGIYAYAGSGDNITLSKNVISNNRRAFGKNYGYSDRSNGSGLYLNHRSGSLVVSNNIITGNDGNYAIYKDWGAKTTVVTNNSIFNNDCNYTITNTDTNTNIDASNNYWGTIDEDEIQNKIYDWFDNNSRGFVLYSPFSLQIDNDLPISPPNKFIKNKYGNDIKFTWSANLETDIAGYKLYYGSFDGEKFEHVLDLGNVTTYTMSNTDYTGDYAITAYDAELDGENDLFEGHESYYSFPKDKDFIFKLEIKSDDIEAISTENSTEYGALITLPLRLVNGSIVIDWGNGREIYQDNNIKHIYYNEGIYTVSIRGDFSMDNITYEDEDKIKDKDKIISLEQWGSQKWIDMSDLFQYCTNLEINATDEPDLRNVTYMSRMFDEATNFNSDINDWNVSNVKYMSYMFHNAKTFNIALNNWNVSKVKDMSAMFSGAISYNGNISNWNVSEVLYMTNMFSHAKTFNMKISNWNVSKVTSMNGMFISADSFNQDLSNWSVNNVTNMSSMFLSADLFNQNLSKWDISNVTSLNYFIHGTNISSENYDNILLGWSEKLLQPDLTFDSGEITYCEGESGRNLLIDTFGWTIIDGGKSLDCSSLELSIIEENSQLIYPNPTSGIINIDLDDINSATIKIYNPSGTIIFKKENINMNSIIVNLEGNSGLYIIEISNNEQTKHYKIIKN